MTMVTGRLETITAKPGAIAAKLLTAAGEYGAMVVGKSDGYGMLRGGITYPPNHRLYGAG